MEQMLGVAISVSQSVKSMSLVSDQNYSITSLRAMIIEREQLA
jgi:hypothetical protein